MAIFQVHKGKRYRARVELSFFESFASNETIAGELRKVGFEDVRVWGDDYIRYAEGTWTQDDARAHVPEQVRTIEEVVPDEDIPF